MVGCVVEGHSLTAARYKCVSLFRAPCTALALRRHSVNIYATPASISGFASDVKKGIAGVDLIVDTSLSEKFTGRRFYRP